MKVCGKIPILANAAEPSDKRKCVWRVNISSWAAAVPTTLVAEEVVHGAAAAVPAAAQEEVSEN